MAWTYFPASAESVSPCNHGRGRSATSKTTDTASACCGSGCATVGSTTPPCGTTCEHSTPDPGLARWTSSVEDSPARTSARQAAGRAWRESEAAYSGRSFALFGLFDLPSFSLRTCRSSRIRREVERMSLRRLPRWGSTAAGACWELTTWEPPTSASAGGCWPTLRSKESGHYQLDRGQKGKERLTLSGVVATPGLMPTLTASQARKGSINSTHGRGDGMLLYRWLPTLSARDSRIGRGRRPNGHTPQLAERIGGQLNPSWAEWYMGYPIGWTESKDSATPSSRSRRGRRSRSSSREDG
jgi:hypothetical protein